MAIFLVGIFEENARLLQWLNFFNAIGPHFGQCAQSKASNMKYKTIPKQNGLLFPLFSAL